MVNLNTYQPRILQCKQVSQVIFTCWQKKGPNQIPLLKYHSCFFTKAQITEICFLFSILSYGALKYRVFYSVKIRIQPLRAPTLPPRLNMKLGVTVPQKATIFLFVLSDQPATSAHQLKSEPVNAFFRPLVASV